MSGILRGVDAPEQWRERFQREEHVRHSLRVAAERLESAEEERVVNIAAAHQAGLSVRQIAAAVRLSPARVHQLLHAPVSSAVVRATTMRWDSSATQTGASSGLRLGAIADLVHECTEWLDRLDREEFVAVNLRDATDPQTEYVAADRAQVRQVLREIAREIEGLAAGSTPVSDEPVGSRRERLASLLPKPARLSPHEERAQLRRQLGLEP
jgi:DNA-binding Lrp family transcriptional regulator